MKELNNYTAKNIKYLDGIEHIRKRPSMYIGNTNIVGLHHLFYELLDNSLDEYLEGYCKKIIVKINSFDTITIEDDGRGIPVDYHKKEKKTALELVLTKIGAGGKFDKSSYKISSGLHGIGLSCVNALSKKFLVKIYRNNNIYKQLYSKGKPIYNLKIVGKTFKRGTKIRYKVDSKIFKNCKYNYKIIKNKLKEITFLNKGLIIYLFYKKKKIKIYSKNGIKDYINFLDKKTQKNVIKKDIIIKEKYKNEFNLKILIRFKYNSKENIISYVNNIKTIDGGTHVFGFKRGLTKIFKKYINNNKKILKNLKGEDIREGIISIISLKLTNPEFEGQTKTKLVNKKISGKIEKIVSEYFNNYLEENPLNRKKIINKITLSYKSRNAAIKAKELIFNKNISNLNKISGIPGKLSDCTYNNPNKCELFLVEGDSAGGTAKIGRNRKFQAILPLKGKILNVEKTIYKKILRNEEIKNIFLALGVFLEKKNNKIKLNIKKLKYKKIIIMTDADIDGKHISSLILTFLFKYMKKLINKGYIYIANPPLYMLKKNKKKIYMWSKVLKKKKYKYFKIQRYKGLGEMNSDQLWNTTMNPKTRKLKKILIKNENQSKNIFNILMGENVEPRRKFIEKYALYAKINI
ncbi:MAG: DNA gyrase subunit B [Candidatus Shikimatogenerans sp. JK-2022]|nr:DNA gyrase subunit B [Candidatus Shikimatogenerans bostrichidophilus]